MEGHGRLDIVENNAAIEAPDGNTWDLPEDQWDRTIAVNLSGMFYCSKTGLAEARDYGWRPEVREERVRPYPLGLGPAFGLTPGGEGTTRSPRF